jgi:hypothetical protein
MQIAEDPIVVAMPRNHPLGHHKVVRRDDLAREQLLLIEDGHCLRSHSPQACRIVDPVRNEVFQATSSANACSDGGREPRYHANSPDRGGFGTRFNSRCCDSIALSRQAVPYTGPCLAADILTRRRIKDARRSFPRVSDWYQESICA